MNSILFLILVLTQVRGDSGELFNCKDILEAPKDINKGFRIYRFYEKKDQVSGLQKERIRLYRRDIEIEAEISSDMTLEFTNITQITNEKYLPTLFKFSVYLPFPRNPPVGDLHPQEKFFNCEFPSGDEDLTTCEVEVSTYHNAWSDNIKYTMQSVIVKPFERDSSKFETVLILDSNKREKWQSWYSRNKKAISCQNDSTKGCRRPPFIRQMTDDLFKQVDAMLDIEIKGFTGHLIVFTIDGRQKYCFTSGESLSKECRSSSEMKTLFQKCFPESTDPQIWILIASAVIAAILLVSIICTVWYCRRDLLLGLFQNLGGPTITSNMTMKSTQN